MRLFYQILDRRFFKESMRKRSALNELVGPQNLVTKHDLTNTALMNTCQAQKPLAYT